MEELTPDETEAVRRLLADARHDDPIPVDLATRLDDVLTGLARERADEAPTNVVPLRRRRWPQVLVAAAAVTVLGIASTAILGGTVGDGGGTGDNALPASESQPESRQDVGQPGDSAELDHGSSAPQPATSPGGALKQTLEDLDVSQLVQLRRSTLAQQLDGLVSGDETTSGARAYSWQSSGCGPLYEVEGATTYAALYRRHVALVLAYPVLDGVRRVDVYDCEADSPRRAVETVTLTGE